MPGLNLDKLKEAQETLKTRGGDAGKNWINLSKIEEPVDFRILDPLPSMDGLYYLEVPTWWINGVKIISPRTGDPKAVDVIEQVVEAAKLDAKNDQTLSKLLNAKDPKTSMPVLQFRYDYWVPGLRFVWKYDSKGDIAGIVTNGVADPELIRKFIEDDRVKFLQANITCLKAINTMLTNRVYKNMLDADKGQNIQIQKSGKGRDTKYAIVATDVLPMPKDFYTSDKFTDPLQVAQALMMTDEYMESVIGNYFYGDEVLNKDDHYRYPEIREALKDKGTEEAKPKEEKAQRRQPQATASAVAEAVATRRPGRPATPPAGRTASRRNLAADLTE